MAARLNLIGVTAVGGIVHLARADADHPLDRLPKIFPSPTSPVRAAEIMACTHGSTKGSEHTISILTSRGTP